MRKYAETLVKVSLPVFKSSMEHYVESKSKERTVGNHMVRAFNKLWAFTVADDRTGDDTHRDFKGNRIFLYHGHIVCVVNDKNKTFVVSHAHWTGSTSTKQAVNQYRNYFKDLGYADCTLKED